MDAIRYPCADRAITLLLLLTAVVLCTAGRPLRDTPVVWHADDRRHLEDEPALRDPSLVWNTIETSINRPVGRFFHPGRIVRNVGSVFGAEKAQNAANVNRLDEVPNSSWFTNRIGLFPMAPEAVRRGPGDGRGPDRSGAWTVVGAKTGGVSKGFRIRDPRGRIFLLKFDPPQYPGMSSAAGAIASRLMHAAGYFVPQDDVVFFGRSRLVVAPDVTVRGPDDTDVPFTDADLDTLLTGVPREPDGTYRALASRFLSGKPLGPFDWQGRRGDDPNDRVDHEDRRELRGLRMLAAWINHFDLKQHNTLDMLVVEDERRFVRHHLIDFASSLGAGGTGPHRPYGVEYSLDVSAMTGRWFALGFHEDSWRYLQLDSAAPELGYFESERFDPMEFKPQFPNSAFADFTARDGYWAAKIISAFTREHVEAAVAAGQYRDPQSAERLVEILLARRAKIVRTWFDRVPPLDFFRVADGRLVGEDLGVARGFYPAAGRYRAQVAAVTPGRAAAGWSPWIERDAVTVDTEGIDAVRNASRDRYPFVAVRWQVDRGEGWSDTVTVFASRTRVRVVGIQR